MIRYSYPVIFSGTDCYDEESVRWEDLSTELSENNIIVRGEFTIEDEGISRLVEEGAARVCALVSCPRTDYRELFDLETGLFEIKIADVAGTVNVEESIIAMRDIDCGAFKHLAEDYRGISTVIPKNGYIAKNDTFFVVDREIEPDSDSICRFVKDADAKAVWYDDNSDFIRIMLPEEIHEKYMTLDASLKKVYTAMFVQPVLQEVIYEYWFKEDATPQSSMWYRVLDKALREKYPVMAENAAGLAEVTTPYEAMNTVLEPLILAASDSVHNTSVKLLESD